MRHYYILFIAVILLSGCKNEQITNIKQEFYSITGKITTLNPEDNKSNIEIILTGETKQTVRTDSIGNYWFRNVSSGNHQIIVNDSRYPDINIDTLIAVKSDMIVNINYEKYFDKFPRYDITGKITTLNDKEDKSGIEIDLKGMKDQTTRTDSYGDYQFKDVWQGNYAMKVNDKRYPEIDTALVINKNLEVNIDYNNFLVNYFPLKIGNNWKFKFDYEECVYCYRKTSGDWELELRDIIQAQDSTLYEFVEKTNATYIKYHYDSTWTNIIIDSTYDINKTDEVKFVCRNSMYLTQLTEDFISSLNLIGKIEFQIIFPIRSDSVQVVYGRADEGHEGHIITIIKDLGMTNWKVSPGHNGGPHMLLWLADSHLNK